MRDLVGPSPKRLPIPQEAQTEDEQPIAAGVEQHSHGLAPRGGKIELADDLGKDGRALEQRMQVQSSSENRSPRKEEEGKAGKRQETVLTDK